MIFVIRRQQVHRMMRWTWGALLIGGLSLLGYCGYVLLDASAFQMAGIRLLEARPAPSMQAAEPRTLTLQHAVPAIHSPAKPLIPAAPTGTGIIGRIEVPRLGLSAIIAEGSDQRTLRRAVGHIAGTGWPGQPGNMAITGHRDTFFRPLRNILQKDRIMLATLQGEYGYQVVSMSIVGPDDVEVLRASDNETLTLITCYPFTFLGPAPRRLIVRAERVE